MLTPPCLTFDEFRMRVLRLYQPPIRQPGTRKKIAYALQSFAAACNPKTTADITTQTVAHWLASQAGRNVNTTVSVLRGLRTALNYGVEEGWIPRAPAWRRVWPRGVCSRRRRDLSLDQVTRLLEHLRTRGDGWRDRRLYALTALVAYTGLRKTEALRLEVRDLDLSRGLLGVVARHRLKTEESAATVAIPGECVEILRSWLPEAGPVWLFPGWERKGPWLGGAPGQRALDKLKAAAREVGVEEVTFHGLRHTLAKLLVGVWGATRDQARGQLRHGSLRTTEDYYLHADDAEVLRYAVRNVSYRPKSAG